MSDGMIRTDRRYAHIVWEKFHVTNHYLPKRSPVFSRYKIIKGCGYIKEKREIRTCHSSHIERPSHCPIRLNEQRETHADEFIYHLSYPFSYIREIYETDEGSL